MLALIASLVFASCSEDEPAKMLWEVTATPSENVKAAFDPSFYHQIQITSDGEGGEVTLKCTNCKSLNLIEWQRRICRYRLPFFGKSHRTGSCQDNS